VVDELQPVYRVLRQSGAQSRLDVSVSKGLTPLVGSFLTRYCMPFHNRTIARSAAWSMPNCFTNVERFPTRPNIFKKALIQDATYQSLLKSTRQQCHRRIAQTVAESFADIVEEQPELLAHHYTEAGLQAQAIGYCQRAGDRAIERSAQVEAISHLSKGLDALESLPNNPERSQHELSLRLSQGLSLMATKGYAKSRSATLRTDS
jgi:hypothetical protein